VFPLRGPGLASDGHDTAFANETSCLVAERGISRKSVRKMLNDPRPKPYGPRNRRYPKLGPHTASVQRMLRENATLPPSARLSVKAIYECIRNEEGFGGSYDSVKGYARPIARDNACLWEYAYDLLISLDKRRAIDFLFLLSRSSFYPVPIHRSYPPSARSSSSTTRVGWSASPPGRARQCLVPWRRTAGPLTA
jgi:hypothetical protein